MSAENTPKQSADRLAQEPTWVAAFRDEPADAQMLIDQRERLEALRALDEAITTLITQKGELEVECIAADAALRAAPTKPALDIDHERAGELAIALHKKRQIKAALEALEQKQLRQAGTPARELEQLKAGRDALVSWLDAPRAKQPQFALKLAYAAVMVATIVVIWIAIVIHPILLLMLLALGAVLAFLRSSEQNTTWFQLGARRHFDDSGLKPPLKWEEASVRERLAELENQIEDIKTPDIPPPESAEDEQESSEQLSVELALATENLDSVLVKSGLDISSIDPDLEQWLELLATARYAQQNLDQVATRLKALNAEKNTRQEALFSFLSRQGEAPRGGSADFQSLSAGLDRLAARLQSKPN